MKKVKTLNTTGTLARIQDNIVTVLNGITDKEILDGVRLINITLTSGVTNQINHSLGREPIGWIIIRKRTQSDIWDLQDDNVNKNRFLSLACSADVTIDLWIF
jgi:hypothetical protein